MPPMEADRAGRPSGAAEEVGLGRGLTCVGEVQVVAKS